MDFFSLGRKIKLPCSKLSLSLLLVVFLISIGRTLSDSEHLIGIGSYDITGPAADVNLMGYANFEQIASGVHFRLRARTFIVAEPDGKRLAFVNLDTWGASQILTIKVLERLKARYGDIYNEQNVAISGTHSHAGPGGYVQYVLYILTSLGFVRESFDVIVDGIEKSIIQAHENLRPGSMFLNTGELLDAGINRSPSAYLNNPAEERKRFKYNVDKDMTLLKFVDDEWGSVGSLSWFATHGTSMSRNNSLISGDNKGAAARFMEDWAQESKIEKYIKRSVPDLSRSLVSFSEFPRRVSNGISVSKDDHDKLLQLASSFKAENGSEVTRFTSLSKRVRGSLQAVDKPNFVAAFAQSNCGDVTPNVLGAFCTDTGLPCDFNHSTCNGRSELCNGRGPGYPDEFESTRIIGDRQFRKAVELFDSASEMLEGKVDYRHSYVDFSKLEVKLPSGNGTDVVKTCPASLGFSFAAGTTDGPGAFDFIQGDDQGNTFWRIVRNILKEPGQEQIDCHSPKPILLDIGEIDVPYAWVPSVLPIQILRVGQLIILSVPGELTTMAGRRLREAVKSVLTSGGNEEFRNVHVVIAGFSNTYSQYITTYEEYQIQRYEGASTLYGPHTLSGYIQEFKKLAESLLSGKTIPPGPQPPDLLDIQISLLPPVALDSTPLGSKFGDVSVNVPSNSTFNKGDVVTVTFHSACPRNDLLTEGTFALVERLDGEGTWIPAYDDDDFCLLFKWSRPSPLSAESYATIEWRIPETAVASVYRIRHFGASKSLFGAISHFTGASDAFVVL